MKETELYIKVNFEVGLVKYFCKHCFFQTESIADMKAHLPDCCPQYYKVQFKAP